MDDDLEGLEREGLINEVKRLRAGIRAHRDSSGHDLWNPWIIGVARWRLGGSSKEGGEGTAQETHAAGASAVYRCRLGARTRPDSGGGAPNRQ